MQAALTCVIQDAEFLRRTRKALMRVVTDGAVAHCRKHHRHCERQHRRKIVHDSAMTITFDILWPRAKEYLCLHRLAQRVYGRIGDLRSVQKDFVKVYMPFYPEFSHEQFTHYLQEFEIESQDLQMQKLSHGQKKKILISFALATNTKILFMDEPTNGLDIPSKSIFRRLMASGVDESRLVIISTHQVRDLHSLIDAIVILENGKILLNNSAEEITQKLVFKAMDEPLQDESVLYSEDNIRGSLIVAENRHNEDSKLDLELLFNATIANKEKIKEIFNYK